MKKNKSFAWCDDIHNYDFHAGNKHAVEVAKEVEKYDCDDDYWIAQNTADGTNTRYIVK